MKKNYLILTLTLCNIIQMLNAQQVWKLKLEKEGIKIYTSPYTDSKIRALKVTCSVDATISQMAAVLLDIRAQDEWFYHTKSIVLTQVSPSELLYYGELSFPFPFSNRDFIEHIKISQNPKTKIMTMDVQNVPDYILPKHGLVRVVKSQCKWTVSPSGGKTIAIEFTLFADPAGAIPVWIVNMFSSYGPFETFIKLKSQLKKPEYSNAHFSFIEN